MNKQEFEASIKNVKNIEWGFSHNLGHVIRIWREKRYDLFAEIRVETQTHYTQANADALNSFLTENKGLFRGWEQQWQAWLRSPEGRLSKAKEEALALAQKAGLEHDEHGGYGRGDYHTLVVLDVIYKKPELRKVHGSGKVLALVEDSRKRVYSKQYMRHYGPGHRTDVYLVGTNENGVPFVHSVSRNCKTVQEAVNWIWGAPEITARHGDIAIVPAKLKKDGEHVVDISVHDNHHFSGEMFQNGQTYLRNGTLHHIKEQHPDVQIGAEWMKIIIAKRAAVGGSRD